MFTGMIEIHDFDGSVEMPGGNPPDPRSSISQHHHLVGLSQTATHRLRIDPPTEGLGGLNGAHVGSGVFVPQRISFVVLTYSYGDSFHLSRPHDHASQCFQVPTTLLEGFFGPYASHHPPHPGTKRTPHYVELFVFGGKSALALRAMIVRTSRFHRRH